MATTVKLPIKTAAKQVLDDPAAHSSFVHLWQNLQRATDAEKLVFPKKSSDFSSYVTSGTAQNIADDAEQLFSNRKILADIARIAAGYMISMEPEDLVNIANYNQAVIGSSRIRPMRAIESVSQFVKQYHDELIAAALKHATHCGPTRLTHVKNMILEPVERTLSNAR